MVEPKGVSKVSVAIRTKLVHFFFLVQLIGFSGSSGPSQSTRLGFFCVSVSMICSPMAFSGSVGGKVGSADGSDNDDGLEIAGWPSVDVTLERVWKMAALLSLSILVTND